VLAYLLPGLRHVRTPLVAGGLWLLIVWLAVGERLVPDAHGSRVGTLLYDLGQRIGRPAELAALALVAMLVGGMSPRLPVRWIARALPINKAGRWWQIPLCRCFGLEPDLALGRGTFDDWLFKLAGLAPQELKWSAFGGPNCPPVLQNAARDLGDSGSAQVGRERLSTEGNAGDFDPRDWLMWGLAEAALRTEIDGDLPLQLHVQRESLFYEFDRVRAESELRAAVVIPLLILIGILLSASWWWALALAVPVWLTRQAVQTYVQAEQQLLTAVRLRVVKSPTVEFVNSLSSKMWMSVRRSEEGSSSVD
jgi:hypothetical protein